MAEDYAELIEKLSDFSLVPHPLSTASEAARTITALLAERDALREAAQPLKWLTDLHEQSRRGGDDHDTTSIFVALGVLRRLRSALNQGGSND